MNQSAEILGVGAVTPIGRDITDIARRLGEPAPPMPTAFRVNDELLSEPSISKRMRRADRFTRMAVVAAIDAWNHSRAACQDVPREQIGLIVTSGFGPHCRGFRFLDAMIDCGDSAASPTDFSHSVHGAAAAYITELLELRGPSLNTTDFENGFEEAVLLAQCWLNHGTCRRVLVGAVEELGDVMLHCMARMTAPEHQIITGEGAVFFMLGPENAGAISSLGVQTGSQRAEKSLDDNSAEYFGTSAEASAFRALSAVLRPAPKRAGAIGVSQVSTETSLVVIRRS